MNQQQSCKNQINKFNLKYQPILYPQSQQVQRLSKLKSLNIELKGCYQTDIKVIKELKFISYLKKLLSLRIYFGKGNIYYGQECQEIFQIIPKLRTLKHFSLIFDRDTINLEEFSQQDVEKILNEMKYHSLPIKQMELTINRNNISCQQLQTFSLAFKRFINLKSLKIEIKDNLIGPQGFLYFYNSLLNLEELEEFTLSIINNQLPVDLNKNLWETISQLKELSYFNLYLQNSIIHEFKQIEHQIQDQNHSMLKTLILEIQEVKNNNKENIISNILTNLSYFPQLINLSVNFEKYYQADQNALIILSECLGQMHNLKQLQLNIRINNQVQPKQMETIFSNIQQNHHDKELVIVQDEDYDLVTFNQDQSQQNYEYQLKFLKDKENNCEISKGIEQSIKYFLKLKKLIIKIKGRNKHVISNLENSNIEEIELYFGSTNQNFNQFTDLFDNLDVNQLKSLKIMTHNYQQVEPEIIQKFYSKINKQKYLNNLYYKIENYIKHKEEIINHISDQISNNQNTNINIEFSIDAFNENDQIQSSIDSLLLRLSKFQSLKLFMNTSDSTVLLNYEEELRSINLLIQTKDCARLFQSILFGFLYFDNLKYVELRIFSTQFSIISTDYLTKESLDSIKLYQMIDYKDMVYILRLFQEKGMFIPKRDEQSMINNLLKPFRQQKVLIQNSDQIKFCFDQYLFHNQGNLSYLKQLKVSGYVNMKQLTNIVPHFSALEILDISIQQENDEFDSTFFQLMQLQSLKAVKLKIDFLIGMNEYYIRDMNTFYKNQKTWNKKDNKLNFLNLRIIGFYVYALEIRNRIKSQFPRLIQIS